VSLLIKYLKNTQDKDCSFLILGKCPQKVIKLVLMNETSLPKDPLSKITEAVLLAGIIAAPLVIIPIFTNFVVTSKLLLLFISATILVGTFVWKTIRTQAFSIPRSPIILPLCLFGLSGLISSILTTQYPTENLLGMGGVYLSAVLLAVIGGQLLRNRSSQLFLNTLNIAAILLAVTTIQEYFGYGPSFLINQVLPLNIPANGSFNVSGALFIAAEVIGITLISNLASVIVSKRIKPLQMIVFPILLLGLGFSIFGILPGKVATPAFLPPMASWQVAVSTLSTPRTALIGYGPESFSDAFQRFKPADLNLTQWWTSVVGQGSNVPLTIVPTLGLVGLAAWVFLVMRILKQTSSVVKSQTGLVTVILSILALQLLTPMSPVLWWLLGIALAFLIANRENQRQTIVHLMKFSYLDPENNIERQGVAKLAPVAIPAIVVILLVGVLLWPIGQAYAASHFFFRGVLAQQANDFLGMYSGQQQATVLNRYISGYRSNYAVTSLTAAIAILNKENASEAEKREATQLIQQAVNEARAATALRPNDAQAWQVLGQVYATLIPFKAEGADQWTVLAYTNAIQNNPTNPLLRLQFGSILYNQQKFEDAAVLFEQAYNLKPDLANTAYSLANTLTALKQFDKAKVVYERTLTLLEPDSEDYKRAQKELEVVNAEIAKQPASPTEPAGQTPQSALPSSLVPPSVVNENVNQSSDQAVDQPQTNQPRFGSQNASDSAQPN